MQEYTDLTRLGGGASHPLTLLAQWAGATTADAGGIDHTQAAIGFSAPLMDDQGLVSGTTKRAIWLGEKVCAREPASFPTRAYLSRSIPGGRRRMWLDGGQGWSKLGGAYRLRLELMAQFQT